MTMSAAKLQNQVLLNLNEMHLLEITMKLP